MPTQQRRSSLRYIDPNYQTPKLEEEKYDLRCASEYPFVVSGFRWFNEEHEFCRLPKSILPKCSEDVQYLAWHTSGGMIRFKTNSPSIVLKATLRGNEIMPHMALSGSSGFDLYFGQGKQKIFHKNIRPSAGKNVVIMSLADGLSSQMRDCTLYLPLYNGITALEIGISPKYSIEAPANLRYSSPILFYGSSITQGGCASRPGNAYTHILCRMLDAAIINFGFSGSARGEPLIAEQIASLNLSAFVLDYDHNSPNIEHLKQTHERFFKIVRAKQPELPIIIVSKCDFYRRMVTDTARRDIIYQTYQNAIKDGDKNVYFIDGETLFGRDQRDACTVDGCHPNDLGFMRMAKKMFPTMKTALIKTLNEKRF